VQSVFCSCSLWRVGNSSQKRWVHIQPGKAAQQSFLLLGMKWALSSMKSLTTGVETRQWHKYLCCLAVGGRLWEDLPQAPPSQVCLYKEMVIWAILLPRLWWVSTQLPTKRFLKKLEKEVDNELSKKRKRRGKNQRVQTWHVWPQTLKIFYVLKQKLFYKTNKGQIIICMVYY
jgi:hypothetical protein